MIVEAASLLIVWLSQPKAALIQIASLLVIGLRSRIGIAGTAKGHLVKLSAHLLTAHNIASGSLVVALRVLIGLIHIAHASILLLVGGLLPLRKLRCGHVEIRLGLTGGGIDVADASLLCRRKPGDKGVGVFRVVLRFGIFIKVSGSANDPLIRLKNLWGNCGR